VPPRSQRLGAVESRSQRFLGDLDATFDEHVLRYADDRAAFRGMVTISARKPDRPPAPEQRRVMYVAMVRASFPMRRQPQRAMGTSTEDVVAAVREQSPELVASLRSQTLFLPGHRLESRRPLDDDPASTATCPLFTGDVDLHRVDGPTGRFEFVQVVPVSPAELREAQQTSTGAVVATLREESPGLVARLRR
jgi:Suppressor of fused protein (SUFU)